MDSGSPWNSACSLDELARARPLCATVASWDHADPRFRRFPFVAAGHGRSSCPKEGRPRRVQLPRRRCARASCPRGGEAAGAWGCVRRILKLTLPQATMAYPPAVFRSFLARRADRLGSLAAPSLSALRGLVQNNGQGLSPSRQRVGLRRFNRARAHPMPLPTALGPTRWPDAVDNELRSA